MSKHNGTHVFADLHFEELAERRHGNFGFLNLLPEPKMVYFHEGRGWLPEDIDRRPLAGILHDAHNVIGTAE